MIYLAMFLVFPTTVGRNLCNMGFKMKRKEKKSQKDSAAFVNVVTTEAKTADHICLPSCHSR